MKRAACYIKPSILKTKKRKQRLHDNKNSNQTDMNEKYFLIITFVFIGQLLFCQTNKLSNIISPPGTSKVSNNQFLDRLEIRNIDWLEFIIDLKQHDSANYYLKYLPDTAINKFDFVVYVDSKKLENYPVTGITYEQALGYCKWRSAVVTNSKNRKVIPKGSCSWKYWSELAKFDPDLKYKIVYRLPSPKEFEKFISLNSINNFDTVIKPNKFKEKEGYYNFIIGNVSEMTSQKSMAKGLDYKHRPNIDIKQGNNKEIFYDKPESWLGFRCVAEYILIE